MPFRSRPIYVTDALKRLAVSSTESALVRDGLKPSCASNHRTCFPPPAAERAFRKRRPRLVKPLAYVSVADGDLRRVGIGASWNRSFRAGKS